MRKKAFCSACLTIDKMDTLGINDKPMVSVCMITYNQKEYVAVAIESILNQKTDFPVELVIGDDCSSDGTREICKSYMDRYPDRITLRLPKANLGMTANFIENLKACKGKYIAFLEGDDCWTDMNKLQKQVSFMETNHGYAFCYHHVDVVQDGTISNKPLVMKRDQPAESSLVELLRRKIWAHLNSVLILNSDFVSKLPEWLLKYPSPDWAFLTLITGDKKIHYMEETMSIYRQHSGGVWSSRTEAISSLNHFTTGRILNKYAVEKKYKKYLYESLINDAKALYTYYRKSDLIKALYYRFILARLVFDLSIILRQEKKEVR